MLVKSFTKISIEDIHANTEIRANLPSVSDWPTFPQLFINGELIGGSDIISELYDSGELQKSIDIVKIED